MPSKVVDGGLSKSGPGPVYLGIDPSLSGFALTALGLDGSYTSWVFKSPQKGVERLMDISLWMSTCISTLSSNKYTVRDVAIEDTVVMSHSAVALGELHGVVRVALRNHPDLSSSPGRYPQQVPPTMVKKFATDRGNAKKNEVMLAVYKKWDAEFRDDNLADSYVLARICSGQANTAYERTVLDKITASGGFRDPSRV